MSRNYVILAQLYVNPSDGATLVMTLGYLNPATLDRTGGKRLQTDDVCSFVVTILQMILKSSDAMKFNYEANLDVSVSHWAFEVYNEKWSFMDEKLMSTGYSPESAKLVWNVVQEVIKSLKKASTTTKTIWEDLSTSIVCGK
ncbi:hypothetical protein Salat_2123300 [Sesamum alatum]|uniref:Uncharacterized protein n=1 Tax=Sesamum alatum TaxID=300844 RepID=A0AAE2CGZ2_9LAMI|nr:hypothetical protein Salat_2123300 [Sesamum alatum]